MSYVNEAISFFNFVSFLFGAFFFHDFLYIAVTVNYILIFFEGYEKLSYLCIMILYLS